jgi:methionyl-tRNA formyltransferase
VRTVYLGTSDFAAAVLRRLADSEHRPALVVTRPDRPRGRGRRLASPAVALAARELGLEVAQPETVNAPDAAARIAAAAPEALCVCAFGALIKEPLLSAHPILNVHPSLLPRWRGAAPVERAIMAGDAATGVSIMRLTEGLDSGPVCVSQSESIREEDTYGSLAGRLQTLGGDLLVQALSESPVCVEQDDAAATYAEKIGPDDRWLDPARPAAELQRRVRALTPHIGARLQLAGGDALGVRRATAAQAPAGGPAPGELTELDGRLLLGCSPGVLELLEVQPAGSRPMDAAAYLRGHGVPRR